MKKSQVINTEMILKNQELAGKQAFYENPHSPSSVNNIPTRQKKQTVQKRIHPLLQRRQVQRLVMSVNHKDTQTKKMCKMW